ncbi:MAG TPA: hypothetical protein VLT87_11285 [Thermoanaerobaculia bacterium]|nr:hypothetical protein [Thermoanaerobaculia bacterium]
MGSDQTKPWILNMLGDGLACIREKRGPEEVWPSVLMDVPCSLEGGFGDFPHEEAIVRYLVACRNELEALASSLPHADAKEAAVEWLRHYGGSYDSTALLFAFKAGARWADRTAALEVARKVAAEQREEQ